jgi:hypothetical protein
LSLAMVLSISGCIGSGIETATTQAIKKIPPVYPTISFGAPSATTVRTVSSASTIAMSFSNAQNVSLTTSNLGITATSGASCTIALTGVTDSSALISLTACTGNGTIRVYLKANSLLSSSSTGNLQSDNSAAVTVDNTGPTVTGITPATGIVAASPSSIVVTFNEAVDPADIVSGLFVTSASTCSTKATAGVPVLSSGNTVATVPLTGAVCSDSQTTVVSVNMTGVHDTIGNTGVSTVVRTYTFTDGPTVAFAAPSATRIRAASPAVTVVATFTNAASAPTIDATTVGLTTTGDAACSTITGTGVSASGATINISGCTGNGTIAAHMNAGSLVSSIGFTNAQSGDTATITVDNTAPSVMTMTPITANVDAIPARLVVHFSEAMDDTTITNTDFVISGDCASPPTVGAPVMSMGNTLATVPLTGGTCADTTTLTLTYMGASSTDTAGNAGTGTVTSTYTFDTTGPSVTLAAPSATAVRAGSAATTIVATFTGGVSTPVLDGTEVGLTTIGTATCGSIIGTGVSSSGGTINVSGCTGDGTVAVHVNAGTIVDGGANPNLQSGDSVAVTVDNTAPTVVVSGVTATNSTVTATFDEAVSGMNITRFAISGCTVDPVAANYIAVSPTVYTIDLDNTTANCASTETLTVAVDATTITDTVGNAGTGTGTSSHVFP